MSQSSEVEYIISPLRRHPEQPPCDAASEACCLIGMFAVPERMAHWDLGPHLIFPEHRAIWRSMKRAIEGDPEAFWWRTFVDLRRERTAAETRALLGVLEFAQKYAVVSDSDNGRLIFVLSYMKLVRCTEARRTISRAQEEVTRAWRAPDLPFSEEEKRRLMGPERPRPVSW